MRQHSLQLFIWLKFSFELSAPLSSVSDDYLDFKQNPDTLKRLRNILMKVLAVWRESNNPALNL